MQLVQFLSVLGKSNNVLYYGGESKFCSIFYDNVLVMTLKILFVQDL